MAVEVDGNWVWWWMSVITTLERLKVKNCEFKGSLGYVVSLGYREKHCQGDKLKKQMEKETGRCIKMGKRCGQCLAPRNLGC